MRVLFCSLPGSNDSLPTAVYTAVFGVSPEHPASDSQSVFKSIAGNTSPKEKEVKEELPEENTQASVPSPPAQPEDHPVDNTAGHESLVNVFDMSPSKAQSPTPEPQTVDSVGMESDSIPQTQKTVTAEQDEAPQLPKVPDMSESELHAHEEVPVEKRSAPVEGKHDVAEGMVVEEVDVVQHISVTRPSSFRSQLPFDDAFQHHDAAVSALETKMTNADMFIHFLFALVLLGFLWYGWRSVRRFRR